MHPQANPAPAGHAKLAWFGEWQIRRQATGRLFSLYVASIVVWAALISNLQGTPFSCMPDDNCTHHHGMACDKCQVHDTPVHLVNVHAVQAATNEIGCRARMLQTTQHICALSFSDLFEAILATMKRVWYI